MYSIERFLGIDKEQNRRVGLILEKFLFLVQCTKDSKRWYGPCYGSGSLHGSFVGVLSDVTTERRVGETIEGSGRSRKVDVTGNSDVLVEGLGGERPKKGMGEKGGSGTRSA